MSKNRYEIEGNLRSRAEVDFAEAPLAVLAFLRGEEVGHGGVDEHGHYRITFESDEAPAATELRVLPAGLAERGSGCPALAKTFNASRYVARNHGEDGYHASLDLPVPQDYRDAMDQVATETYRFAGNVYTVEGVSPLQSFEPLPGARIDFYEVDWPASVPLPPYLDPASEGITWSPETEQLLGSVETGPDGSFDFQFDFSVMLGPGWPPLPLGTDVRPDVRVRIHQFVDGTWTRVWEGATKWNVGEVMHCRFLVPKGDTFPVPDPGVKPEVGFSFTSLGLLPLDASHLAGGYVSGLAGDPAKVAGLRHQPLCGKLRIFGLFAESPAVASYRVQFAEGDPAGATGSWQTVTDPLNNRRWNEAEMKWEHVVLGPDPDTGRYRNVDVEADADWHEHALKVTWNTANVPNGFYALRITGYDAAGSDLGSFEMPVLRVDNDPPMVDFEALDAGVCGGVALSSAPKTPRAIRFRIVAHDSEGHVLQYEIHATRGRDAQDAYDLKEERDPNTDLWAGTPPGGDVQWLAMPALPPELASCTSALAYNFELAAQGLATDCYSRTNSSQRIKEEVNLIVAE